MTDLKRFRIFLPLLFLFFLLLHSHNSLAQTPLCGAYTTNTTLSLVGSPYILTCDITINPGVTLTIEPGVNIEFPFRDRDIIVQGTLIANGTLLDSIRFFGSGGSGGGSVVFQSTSTGSQISYAVIDSLGTSTLSSFRCGLYIDQAMPTVSKCRFGLNGSDVRASAISVGGFDESNRLDQILLLNNSLNQTATWPVADDGGFYYQVEGDLQVMTGTTLTIEPGVEVQFPNRVFDLEVQGTLIANGTALDSIRFVGTAADGGGSIVLQASSVGSSLDYCTIDKMGSSILSFYQSGIYQLSLSASINHCSFVHNLNDVRADADAVSGFGGNNSLEYIKLLNNSLSMTTIWPNADPSGFYYQLEGDQTVGAGTILTVESGVEIKFPNRAFDLEVNGSLQAVGSALDSIRFSGAGPDGGGSVVLRDGSGPSNLQYCKFNRMGYSTLSFYQCGIYNLSPASSVDHCRVDSTLNDVRLDADCAGGFGPSNALDYIKVLGNSLDTTSVWPNADTAGFYYLLEGDILVDNADSLTIDPGVEVSFPNRSFDITVNGTLIANGSVSDSIRFYSVNTDGGGSVVLNTGSTGSQFQYCIFDSLGVSTLSAYQAALYALSPDYSLNHCTFRRNTNDVRADADVVGNFGPDNSLHFIKLFNNSLDTTSVWPNVDPDGFYYQFEGDQVAGIGDTLWIEPGVEINLPNRSIDLIIYGRLIAEGSAADSIRFYSVNVDAGGSVVFQSGSSGSLDYVILDSLGVSNISTYYTALYILSPAVSVKNCRFLRNSSDVKARADAVGGFESSNRLRDIDLLNSSLGSSSVWPNADDSGFYYYLEGDQTVSATDTLWIEPGVSIEFPWRNYDLQIYGHLFATGTPTDSIRFYSLDSGGGGSVAFFPGSKGVLDYTVLDSLGVSTLSTYRCGLYSETADLALSNSTFRRNMADVKSRADGLAQFASSNRLFQIQLISFSLGGSAVWPNADATGFYYELLGDQTLSLGDTLLIKPGVSVSFPAYQTDLVINGTMLAEGTASDSIRFYSDGVNGGGSVYLSSTSAGSRIGYAVVENLGISNLTPYYAGIRISNSTALVYRSSILNNVHGIYVDNAQTPSIIENYFTGNTNGLRVTNGNPLVRHNAFVGNAPLAINNTTPSGGDLNACKNWFGDASGPYNAMENPTGMGDTISDQVTVAGCFYEGPLGDCGKDGYEPNDSKDQAANLYGGAISGFQEMRICGIFDQDWFYFQVPAGRIIRVRLENLAGNYDLELHDGTGMVASSTKNGSADEWVNYTSMAGGTYYVRVYSDNFSMSPTQPYNLIINLSKPNPGGVGIKPAITAPIFRTSTDSPSMGLYPNPASGQVFVSCENIAQGSGSLQLLNGTGKIVRQEAVQFEAGTHRIPLDLTGLAGGIYFVRVSGAFGTLSGKLVVGE